MSSDRDKDQGHIDQLLERYLALLDEYTALRKQLSSLQSDVYHNIARANFSGERGLRYGQDHYDERMRASRRVGITNAENGLPRFTVTTISQEDSTLVEAEKNVQEEKLAEKAHDVSGDGQPVRSPGTGGEEGDKEETKSNETGDPLRWFGILTPMPLRAAQRHSIRAVEDVVPRLVSVNAEMQHVEIEVRRARKRRAKAAAAQSKGRAAEAATTLGQEVGAA
ncbi:hypothetical protein J3458_008963 [Metarhizium acridum]|uniref:Vacuolar ATPase assembly protein VMA22 n=1 Tax=Metarhizium acridum (strain CQMa 102) TaxID=655827 RepID=E9E596_METAQ|nr:uncharacterized protein MAC_05065 [Metarhizium acridum CQMa 102]EFY88971.1 hypothetical protein MAC_05065 [Metarhizium acridum CQMa 102]KAG8415082.1 hypothetical protein J3458_008963 [Metarhizium acridum]